MFELGGGYRIPARRPAPRRPVARGYQDPVGAVGMGGAAAPPLPVPGFTPNYASLIENDPAFSMLKTQLSAQGIADAAQRDAAMERALGQYGAVPQGIGAGLGPGFADIANKARAIADQNTKAGLSTVARLSRAHDDAVMNVKDSLAARGIARSGATGVQLNREQNAYTTASYDSTQKLLDYLSGVQSAYVTSERNRQAQIIAGMQEAGARQASYPWNVPTDPSGTGVAPGASYAGAPVSGGSPVRSPYDPPPRPRRRQRLTGTLVRAM